MMEGAGNIMGGTLTYAPGEGAGVIGGAIADEAKAAQGALDIDRGATHLSDAYQQGVSNYEQVQSLREQRDQHVAHMDNTIKSDEQKLSDVDFTNSSEGIALRAALEQSQGDSPPPDPQRT